MQKTHGQWPFSDPKATGEAARRSVARYNPGFSPFRFLAVDFGFPARLGAGSSPRTRRYDCLGGEGSLGLGLLSVRLGKAEELLLSVPGRGQFFETSLQ